MHRFTHALHPVVAFVIMPVFAFANSGVSLHGGDRWSLRFAPGRANALMSIAGIVRK